jgi:hypothetical protein
MTTPNINKSLSDIFDIDLIDTDKSIDELKINAKAESIDSLEAQREYVKKNIIALIEKGTKALDGVIAIAESTEVAKDFNVVSELLKTLVDTNMTLLECEVAHKPKIDLAQPPVATEQITNNTVFVGSTQDLAAYLKKPVISTYDNIIENKK